MSRFRLCGIVVSLIAAGCVPGTLLSPTPSGDVATPDRLALPGTDLWSDSSPERAAADGTFYVSPSGDDSNPGSIERPFRSLARARDAVRPLVSSMSSNIIVYLRGGTYSLSSTLVLDARDSGQNGFRVIYKAYPGETPVLSGGTRISGWTAATNGIVKASVGSLRFRQLYVNGQRAIRARSPNASNYCRVKSWDREGHTIIVGSGEVGQWADMGQVEMVIHREWTQNNLRIESIQVSGEQATITPMEPERTGAFSTFDSFFAGNEACYFENALELLDAPGEWYLRASSGELFYMPRPGENMSSAVVIAPALERLVQIQGSPSSSASNIELIGITFQESVWNGPSASGFLTGQADSWSGGMIPAAVHIQDAEHIRVERAHFRNLGASALALFSGVHDAAVVGTVFRDIAASAIQVGMDLEKKPADPWTTCRNIQLRNNSIRGAGRDYHSSIGIFAGYTDSLSVEHNEVMDVPYTGISVGWGWTIEDSPLRNNSIRANRIHNAVTTLADGAGIYTLSKQPGTVIAENYVFDIVRGAYAGSNPVAGVYLDEQSSEMTVENNVYENVDLNLFLHMSSNNKIINHTGSLSESGSANNQQLTQPGFDPKSVKSNAGVEPSFQDILTGG